MFLFKRCSILLCLFANTLGNGQSPAVPSRQAPSQRDQTKARDAWFQRGRVLPGQSPAVLRLKAFQQKLQMRGPRTAAKSPLTSADVISQIWQPLGPAPLASDASGFGQQDYGWVSGRATSVVIDRSDPSANTVYVGGAFGGLWKSSNAAGADPATVVWKPLIDDQPTLAVGAIAIQQQINNPNPSRSVVLVGTGETNSSTDSYYGLGILRSTNGGSTWSLIRQDAGGTHSFAGLGFSKIVFSTLNTSRAVAGVAGASQGLLDGLANPATANLGIYYSSDSGASWNFANIADSGTTIVSSSVISLAYNDASGIFLAAVRSHGFYSSADGVNWTRLANQPGPGLSPGFCPPATSPSCPIYRGELAAVPGRNEMYAWYVDANANDQGFWKTTDGGNSWAQISTTTIDSCGDALGCGTENGSYNLTLSAVPNGATATDLYAGAINVYKCSLNSLSLACNGPNTFLNLTHSLGCSPNFAALAHVHPAQHAMDSLVVNGRSVIYFANDGGIYRALDGYTGLTGGDCTSNNQFDSLNQTLGSMTQFVAFSQHPLDANTLLGGTQGNGSPATGQALVGSGWQSVNSGDGGFVEINPSEPLQWFTSNPGANIQRCDVGIACHAQDFEANRIVSSANLDGDQGGFYTPFVLDPQNPGEMIVGTCRVWRGMTDGSNFAALSDDLDSGSPAACSGNEANQVRSFALGGPSNSLGLSQVIYAGTDGFGPLLTTIPAAGRVWVTQNSDAGPSAWADRTGSINPQHFPISSIAMDPSDANGTTAYAGIMGFHTPHVWMTPSAGISWFNFTGNLPDTPVNAIVIDAGLDPLSGTIYVGTDIGVFSSSTASPNWTEVGPPSGQTGFLPNVPVTALRIFTSGPTKLLRASTYGRGLWQFDLSTAPDFQIAVGNPIQTILPAQTATYIGALTAINGYNSNVSLTCVSGSTSPPANCAVTPGALVPSGSFSITASGVPGDYSFKLHATGGPPDNIVHDLPLALHIIIIDFDLTVPAPAIVNASPGNASEPTDFQVIAQPGFSGTITLSCSGLPAGAVCNFLPSNVVSPIANTPVLVTLTIGTTSATPSGSFAVVIHGSTGSAEKTQSVTLAVSDRDYALTVSNPSLSGTVNTPATFNGLLITANGYNSPVNLSCGAGAPPSCTVASSPLVPSPNGAAFTVTVQSGVMQSYSFDIVGQGTDAAKIAHKATASFQSTFDFSFTTTPDSQSVIAGKSASFTLDLSPQGGQFLSQIALSCSSLPSKSVCSFSPAQVTSGSGTTQAVLTISTTAATISLVQHTTYLYALWLPGLAFLCWSSKRVFPQKGLLLLALATLLTLPGCGGGLQGNGGGGSGGGGGGGGPTQPGTTPGTYIITVTATGGSLSHTATVTLTVQ